MADHEQKKAGPDYRMVYDPELARDPQSKKKYSYFTVFDVITFPTTHKIISTQVAINPADPRPSIQRAALADLPVTSFAVLSCPRLFDSHHSKTMSRQSKSLPSFTYT